MLVLISRVLQLLRYTNVSIHKEEHEHDLDSNVSKHFNSFDHTTADMSILELHQPILLIEEHSKNV